MDAFFGGGQPRGRGRSSSATSNRNNSQQGDDNNPVMDFLRSVTGQPAMDAATAAAAQFGDFMNQIPHQFQQQQQQQQSTGPPPASAAALRTLPVISVSAEDLVEPSNRECCICFEEHNLGDKVVRLPCAHIYHKDCITDWLRRSCTCPTCRYELPTEDPMYEAGRRERMSHRKPRFAKYELERMSIRELKQLLPRRRQQSAMAMFSDKSDLIDYLISKELVDLINAPPPVNFPNLAVLRVMGVGQLKRTMNETGVYYDPREVVEKEDMVQIFVNSGRICLTEPEPDTGRPDTGYGHEPGTRQRSFSVESIASDNNVSDNNNDDNNSRERVIVETVNEADDTNSTYDEEKGNNSPARDDWDSDQLLEETGFDRDQSESGPPGEDEVKDDGTEVVLENDNATVQETPPESTSPARSMEVESTVNDESLPPGLSTAAASSTTASIPVEDVTETEWIDESEVTRKRERDTDDAHQRAAEEAKNEEAEAERQQWQRLSISQLRAMGRESGVDLSNCLERSEMIQRISSASLERQQQASDDLALAVHTLEGWSASQLKTCGKAVQIDLSNCNNREDMIQMLSRVSEHRPTVATTILALSPLMKMNIKQLRAQAIGWNVPVADCIEKGEIIHRLAAPAARRRYRG